MYNPNDTEQTGYLEQIAANTREIADNLKALQSIAPVLCRIAEELDPDATQAKEHRETLDSIAYWLKNMHRSA